MLLYSALLAKSKDPPYSVVHIIKDSTYGQTYKQLLYCNYVVKMLFADTHIKKCRISTH